ncbi:MAG: response regulator [Acetobacteraceae bacterium]|nr:response regulator [Acetobacteraceae bacterium]
MVLAPPRLLLRRAAAARQDADRSTGSAGAPLRGRVLIVEDEYFVALASEDALLEAGFGVVGVAATAEDAVALAGAERPDLVLMDIRLAPPGAARDGIDAAAEILARYGIPSLFATAHADPGTRLRGERAAQPLGWLSKPYSPEELVAAVGAAVAEARRRHALPGSGG